MNTKRFYVVPFFIFALWITSFTPANGQENDDQFVVVLDAGHGGHDPGNLGNGYLEKNIALNIVLRVGAILERAQNIKVVYTRKDDTFIDLFVRGEIANKANADLFVSVHCDSHTSDAYGAGTFVLGLHANKQNFEIAKKENSVIYLEDNYETRYADYDINSPESVIGLTIMQEEFLDQSISLAKAIQDNFTGKLNRKNREVKQAGFIVLHQTFMPSVLVETGFLTNDAEGAYLNSQKGQSEMGTAIAEAIMSYQGGLASSLSQAPQKVIMPAPDPEKEVVASSPSVAKDTEVDEKDIAEEFAKDPGANPMADKPVVAERVEKTLEEKIADVNKAPEVVETIKDEVKEVAEQPKELAINKVDEIFTEEEIIVEETPEVAEVVKEVIERPTSPVVENKEVMTNSPVEVSKPAKPEVSIEFRVQLMATTKNLPLDASRFNGLNKLSKERYKQFYRYMYGSTNSYSSAKELKKAADRNGYPASYIVAYKDGVRILTPDAIKMVSE